MELGGGPDLVNGGRTAAGDAWIAAYTANRYHKPGDVWSPDWDLRGAAQDVALLYDMGRQLADSDVWPSWNCKLQSLRQYEQQVQRSGGELRRWCLHASERLA